MNKKLLNPASAAMALAMAAVILSGGCSRSNTAKKSAGVPVLAAQAIETNVPVQIQPEPVGHVEAYSTVTVRSQITGILQKIHFQEGQEVRAGDLLFTIDPRPAQAALVAARANLARDNAQLEKRENPIRPRPKAFHGQTHFAG
ncbi:MAG: biotin/lipoyl-binding protein [Limisphaerales bacterium]